MPSRIHYGKTPPGAMKAMQAVQQYVNESGLEPRLLELVKLRASQINGCAYCIDMHTKDARAMGETETVSTVLIGARNEEQLRQNLGALGWSLSAEQVAKLDAASAVMPPYPYYPYRNGQFSERNPAVAGVLPAWLCARGFGTNAMDPSRGRRMLGPC